MAWVHLLGRRFAAVLTSPDFELVSDWPYWNRFGRKGYSYYGKFHRRTFCISQSACDEPDTMAHLASILKNGDSIDNRVGPFYSNSLGHVGLLVAAWDGSQWVQMISPGVPYQPHDSFTELSEKIRADKTIDPCPLDVDHMPSRIGRLQELEDALKNLRGRTDFDW